MIDKKVDFSLQAYNTFNIDVKANLVYFLKNLEELQEVQNISDCLFIGGGSNVLLTSDLDQTVVVNETKGITKINEDNSFIWLKVASGENWHELVLDCVSKNYGGIENMSLIPGSVGAAPMQNIGAYGAEIKDVLEKVYAVNLSTLVEEEFSNEDCQFGYRESIFKKEAKGKYFISSIVIKLTKINHEINTSYGAIAEVLAAKNIQEATIMDVSKAVIEIRQSKLPDPAELGNAGSFFKNPIIPKAKFDLLQEKFPQIKCYPAEDDNVKVPAGWLIESLGWKGKVVGKTGSHKNQALVLVNYGGVKGSDVKALSEAIKISVLDTYGIQLETEVNII